MSGNWSDRKCESSLAGAGDQIGVEMAKSNEIWGSPAPEGDTGAPV